MTEEITTSLLTKVLEWIPEHWHEQINSSGTLLNIILNEVLSDRDIRITGGAGAARAESALIATLQKTLNRQDGRRFPTLIVCPSRESEEIMTGLAQDLVSSTSLVVRSTAALRTKTSLVSAFETPADVIVTSLHGLEKLLENELLTLENIRTVIFDDIEWFQCLGDLRQLERLTETLPAARQIIGITAQGDLDNRIVNLFHAPVVCRAPELCHTPVTVTERLIVVPEDQLQDTLGNLADGRPTLYISDSPTEAARLASLLKSRGHDPKRATTTQTETARQTLMLKFSAGLVTHVICPTSLLSGFSRGTLSRIVQTDIPGGARPYLHHAALLSENGELITVTTPDGLAQIESLLLSAQKKLAVENPTGLIDLPDEIGQIVSRQKLTIRTDFSKTNDETPEETTEQPLQEDRPYRRKNNKFAKNRRFGKRDKFRFKNRRQDSDDTYDSGDGIPQENDSAESFEKKPFKKRRSPYQRKRPYREYPEGDALTVDQGTQPAEQTSSAESPSSSSDTIGQTTTEASSVEDGHNERVWRPKSKYNRFKKPYRKDRRPAKQDGDTDLQPAVQAAGDVVSDTPADDNRPPRKFTKYPLKKRPYQPKPKKGYSKPRDDNWEDDDDDNFGNSIHYQPRRQNLRTLRSDEPLHWEPSDPFHPSSQALSLPQMMPDENGFRTNRPRNDRKGNFHRSRKPGFKKYRGSGDN